MNKYYDEHAVEFINETFDCDMSNLYSFFEKYATNIKTLLDVGFGSGRDMVYFKNKGIEVFGIDPSIEMCNNAKKIGLNNVFDSDVLNMNFNKSFDAIWACASLLHVESKFLNQAFKNCANALKNNGIMYCSFKYGDFEGERNGRFFVDMTEDNLKEFLKDTGFSITDMMITEDVRPNKTTKWLNVILTNMK